MSFTSFLTDTELLLASAGIAFIAGVLFSQKVKDFASGVPSEVRSALSSAESSTLTSLKQVQADTLAKLLPQAKKAAAPFDLLKPLVAPPAPVPVPVPVPVAAAPSPAVEVAHGSSETAPGHTA